MVSSVCTGFQLPVWKNDNKTELGTAQTPEENTAKGSQSAHGHLTLLCWVLLAMKQVGILLQWRTQDFIS